MHDVGMNMSQLAMSVKQVDDTIELAHEWSHQLLHATENFDMERIGAKLEAAMAASSLAPMRSISKFSVACSS